MKKSLKIVALTLSMVLAVTIAGCSTSTAGSDDNDGNGGGNNTTSTGTSNGSGTSSEDDKESSKPNSTSTSTYTVTYTDGVDDVEIAVPADSAAYHTGDTVTIQFDGIGSRIGYKFVGWSDGATTYTSNGTTSFVMGSSNVTFTAQWSMSYIGKKVPTEAKAVGDIVFEDGSATSYASDLTLTDEQKSKAIAVIFYVGKENDPLGKKTLGVGLRNTWGESKHELFWATVDAEGYGKKITNNNCAAHKNGDTVKYASDAFYFSGDTDGSDNWAVLCEVVSDEGEPGGKYPAWEWANAYPKTDSLAGDWYMPTLAELCMMSKKHVIVEAALKKAGGMEIGGWYDFWSSSEDPSTNGKAWSVTISSGFIESLLKGNCYSGVCCVRVF